MKTKIKNATIIDGTGKEKYQGEILINDDIIEEIGTKVSDDANETIDADGLYVTPGFIDTHCHSDLMAIDKPELLPKVCQGVTTDLMGQDGVSVAPLPENYIDDWKLNISGLDGLSEKIDWHFKNTEGYLKQIENSHPSINVAYLLPHGNIRMEAMGLRSGEPTYEELEKMRAIVKREMKAGAFGISTGLIYFPCAYAGTEEIIEVCKVASKLGGVYVTHQRSEGDDILNSAREVIRIGRESKIPVHFSHLKVEGRKNWKDIDTFLGILEAGEKEGIDVSFDQYPYTAGSTTMGVMVPPWAHEGGADKLIERLKHQDDREHIKKDIINGIEGWDNFADLAGLENIYITDVQTEKNQKLVGKSLIEAAEIRGQDVYEAILDILLEEENCAGIIDFYGREEDIERFIQRKEMNLCTDGIICAEKPHPRAYGAFARLIEKYVREKHIISIEQAIYKMSGKAAEAIRIPKRGKLKKGYFSDINLIDYEKVHENGTYEDPMHSPDGFVRVIVNGKTVVKDGKFQGVFPGRVLRKQVTC